MILHAIFLKREDQITRLFAFVEFVYHPKARWSLVASAALLQAVGMISFPISKPVGVALLLSASALLPIIALLARSFKEMCVNLLCATAPVPLCLGFLFVLVTIVQTGKDGFSMSTLEMLGCYANNDYSLDSLFLILGLQLKIAVLLKCGWFCARFVWSIAHPGNRQ